MKRYLSTIAVMVGVIGTSGCSTLSTNKTTAKVMTPQQAMAESAKQEARLRAELHEEANGPGIPRADYRRMRLALNRAQSREDHETSEYEKFKFQQQLALAQASAPRVTVINGGEGAPNSGTLPASYTPMSRHASAGLGRIQETTLSSAPLESYRVRDRSYLAQNRPPSGAKDPPARFYRRQVLENSADRLVQSAAEAARDAAAISQATTDTGAPFADPVPGRPGYTTSPATGPEGLIDMRGYAPGTHVVDPYTGKVIRVP